MITVKFLRYAKNFPTFLERYGNAIAAAESPEFLEDIRSKMNSILAQDTTNLLQAPETFETEVQSFEDLIKPLTSSFHSDTFVSVYEFDRGAQATITVVPFPHVDTLPLVGYVQEFLKRTSDYNIVILDYNNAFFGSTVTRQQVLDSIDAEVDAIKAKFSGAHILQNNCFGYLISKWQAPKFDMMVSYAPMLQNIKNTLIDPNYLNTPKLSTLDLYTFAMIKQEGTLENLNYLAQIAVAEDRLAYNLPIYKAFYNDYIEGDIQLSSKSALIRTKSDPVVSPLNHPANLFDAVIDLKQAEGVGKHGAGFYMTNLYVEMIQSIRNAIELLK